MGDDFQPDIAIVGMGCRFPGAESVNQFWDLLASARSAVGEIPEGRWAKGLYFHPARGQAGRSYTWAAGVLGDVAGFDAAFFSISPREARQMDPQQRLLLEVAWEALEDAGLPTSRLAGSETGVYVGVSGPDYANLRWGDPASGDAYFMTGTTASIVANRLSYVFDLRGPSFSVDTACSSSLVALHQACEALRRGEVATALVGGVNLLLSPFPFIGFCQASMLSPTGRCHAFDARADGYVRGEGAGVVVLKPLADALRDGDRVRGVIRATGVNSDGRTMGLSLPSEASQSALLRTVYDRAGIGPEALSFIEAHGTGTLVGDPIELTALGRTLAQKRAAPLPIGSVKTNIGHLETASGMAGLIKTVLAFENRQLPPSLNFETPNPHIPFDELGLEVAATSRPLPDADLLAGVNSFGFGGTNAHAVVASAPRMAKPPRSDDAVLPPLLLSARSQEALAELAGSWRQRLAEAPEAAPALLRAQARRRDHHRHRLYARGTDAATLADALAEPSRLPGGIATPSARMAFVYSGNGAQFAGMGRDALAHSQVFRAWVEKLDGLLAPLLGWSVLDELRNGSEERLRRTDVAQPLLFAVQVAVTEALRACGIEGEVAFGHSVGEIAAGWAAGALSLETACRIVVARSHQQHRTAGAGGMAALSLEEADIAELGPGIEVAARNSRSGVTVAGTQAALSSLAARAQQRNWRFVRLDLDYAFHSSQLDPIRDDLLAELGAVDARGCGTRFVSTVTGDVLCGEALDAHYWWRNVREPVLFADAARAAVGRGIRIFVEIGPNPILQSYLRDALRGMDADGRVLSTLARQTAEVDPFVAIAGRCYGAGHDPSGLAIFDGACDITGLPRHPWQRTHYWFPVTSDAIPLADPPHIHPLLGYRRGDTWTNTLDLALMPWLADHAVEGVAVLPAAAMLELACAVARETGEGARVLCVADLEIRQALALEEGRARQLHVRRDGELLVIESRTHLGDEEWAQHAVARLAPDTGRAPPRMETNRPVSTVMDGAAFYAWAATMGLTYGPHFQVISKVEILDDDHARASLTGEVADGWLLSPALADGGLQAFLALQEPDGESTILPWRMTGVTLFPPYGRSPCRVDISVHRRGTRSAMGSLVFFDADGIAVADVAQCWFRQVRLTQRPGVAEQAFRFALKAKPLAGSDEAPAFEPAVLLGTVESVPRGDCALLLEGFVVAAARQALLRIIPPDAPFSPDQMLRQGLIAGDEAAAHLTALLGLLARHGAAMEENWQWRLLPDVDLPEPFLIWRTVLAESPALVGELALAAATADALPQFLKSGKAPQLPPALVEQFLYASPDGRRVGSAICSAVLDLAARWPKGRPLRILEIGAGSGGMARRIMDAMASWHGTLRYVAADGDAAQVARLSAQLREYSGADALVWDGRAPLAERFDLVLSAYGFSRGGMDEDRLRVLHAGLATNALLLAAEPEPGALWDSIFGTQPGWWLGATAEFPVSPLRTAAAWQEELAQAGFVAPVDMLLEGDGWPVSLIAARRPADVVPVKLAVSSGSVLVAAGSADMRAAALVRALESQGVSARVIAADAAEWPASGDVVLLPPRGGDNAVSATCMRLGAVLKVAQRLNGSGRKLWLVTEGAQHASAAPLQAEDAALWGLGRTLMNEMPGLDCRMVDMGGAFNAAALAHELLAPDGETEIVLLPEGRQVMRLEQGFAPPSPPVGPVRLKARMPGRLDSLVWEEQDLPVPGPGEIAVSVRAVDVNFRDVMWSLDLLPEEALLDGYGGPTLGLACSGVVRAVGAGVTDLKPGDPVLAIAPSCFASEVIARRHTVAPLPRALDFATAATLPVAFVTVLYALDHLADLKEGETVLVHGGAGGVGLAALQFAKHRGATVIATAGSPAKRAFLKQMGADHVLESRDLSFVEGVKAITGGAGVDVVLNSLSGEAMEQSLALLRPFGRFLELGKRDFFTGTRVGLKPLRRNISYFAVDVDALPVDRPDLSARLMQQLMDLIGQGALTPLPYRLFARAEAAEAFRLMQQAGHIGKIVLSMEEVDVAYGNARTAQPFAPRSDGTYVVTGGLAGFGLATAEWLAGQGAGALALMGRRGTETPGASEALARLEQAGIKARAFAVDVADAVALDAALTEIRKTMPPIRGVVHAAMTLDDGLLADMDIDRFAPVLAPKLGGAANLDRLTRRDPLELFLLYSSATAVLGAPGQGSYVAANSALEGLARRRRAQDLPAFVVGWGPIADAGFLARNAGTRETLARRLAANPMNAREALDALPKLMSGGAVSVAFAAVRWDAARRLLPVLGSPPFAALTGSRVQTEDGDLREQLRTLPLEEGKELLLLVLREEIARILSSAAETLDPQRPVSELGMDSLMAVELRLALEQRVGVNLPMLSLSPQTSLAMIAARLARDLTAPDAADPAMGDLEAMAARHEAADDAPARAAAP